MIEIKKFIFNQFIENTYVIWDEKTNAAMVIDPGCSEPNEREKLSGFIEDNRLNLKYLIITHAHIDHLFGVDFIKQKFNPIYLGREEDMSLFNNTDKQAALFGMDFEVPQKPDSYIEEGKNIFLGSTEISFLFTPGHSPGGYCLYFPNEEFCISGDVLFQGSIGRTDLWGGDFDTLINSIKEKLFTLPDDTIIYPGHGDSTRIGIEKRENPFVKI